MSVVDTSLRLEPCDVLMCYGDSFMVSRFLRGFNGGSYSHGALYYGDPDSGREVVEARRRGMGLPGVYFLQLSGLKRMCRYIDVYRYRHPLSDGARRAIRGIADGIVRRGAYYDMIYAALLLFPSVANGIRERIHRIFGLTGRRYVCTELVYRCFADAFTDGRYAFDVSTAGAVVTPRDIELSPSLKMVGRIHEETVA